MNLLAALLTLSVSLSSQDGGKIAWAGKSDPKAAMADARRQNRPMMLFFTSVG